MPYDNHDANIIKSALEAVIMNPQSSERQAREGLAALERIVNEFLPEGAFARTLKRYAERLGNG